MEILNTHAPLVSIALATYNGATWLGEQMDSLLAQTQTDFEIVVCDDHSTDGTRALLEQYAAKDSRVKLHFFDEQVGSVKNFSRAVSYCCGQYIALCDQDDVWLPNHLSVLLETIGDKHIACADFTLINTKGEPINHLRGSDLMCTKHLPDSRQRVAESIIIFINCFSGQSMLITRNFAQLALPVPANVKFHDYWFALCALHMEGIAYSPTIITRYRRHDHNVSPLDLVPPLRLGYFLMLIRGSWPSSNGSRRAYLDAVCHHFGVTNGEDTNSLIDTALLQHLYTLVERQATFKGRMVNMCYAVRHFKGIYRTSRSVLTTFIIEVIPYIIYRYKNRRNKHKRK